MSFLPIRARRALPVAAALLLLAVLLPAPSARAQEEERRAREVLVSTHEVLAFDKEFERVAVGDPDIVSFEPLSEKEGLVLGRTPGRTTILVWFADGSRDTFLFQVRRDLSLLEDALADIHPSIVVQAAPDRDAVVLRGLVPDITYANAAEETAQRYLGARTRRRVAPPAVVGGEGGGDEVEVSAPSRTVEAGDAVAPEGVVINLIRVETLPGLLEDRMQAAIADMGSARVRVRRLVKGRMPDDDDDIFLLEGKVATQAELVRVLSAARSFLGDSGEEDIEVVADESGALTRAGDTGAGGIQGSSSLSGLLGSGGGTSALENLVRANLGRAKVIQAAGGRLLSFVDVTDIPQVRVDIKLYEVNTSKLRAFNSDFAVLGSNFHQPSLNPAAAAGAVQGRQAARVGSRGQDPDIQNVLGFLAGTLSNQLQLSGDNFAIDSVLSLLESKGWARSLSRPSLTVLSGEQAFFQVGGEVPVPTSFATTSTAVTEGVFNSIVFRPFGVQLRVRPLVEEGGRVTLDVIPEVSLPDPQLTGAIRESTGSSQATTAFRTRFLQTTARLKDGDALLVGGLMSRNMSSTDESTPGLSDLPLVGGLFSGYDRSGDEIQLVVVVHPVVVREPCDEARTWSYPDLAEIMRGASGPDNARWDCR